MIQKILSTAASRILIAFANLAIVWIIARYLGATSMGTISLIILGISIIQLVAAVLSGSSLVYQVSRHPLAQLLIMAWIWVFVAAILVWGILAILQLIPSGYMIDVLFLSILGGIITINQNVFLGKEQVNHFNALAILQAFLILVSLAIMVVFYQWLDVRAYVTAQYISMSLSMVVGTYLLMPPFKDFKIPGMKLVKEAAEYGGYLQAASFTQLFNYRLSYYIIEKFFDRATLGVFSVGVQIAESVWIIAKSMAVLQYSRISNSRDKVYSVRLTLQFFKVVGIITTMLIILIMLLPQEFFVWMFKSDFKDITLVIASLSIGILAVALSLMFSHYFSGTGSPQYNTISSIIGLMFTIVLGFTLIPWLGLYGAGITASISYLSSMIYQLLIFKNRTRVQWKDFFPSIDDFRQIRKELKLLFFTG